MNPNKIPYSANRKVCWEDGYNKAIEDIEIMIKLEEITTEEEYIFKKIILQRIYELKSKGKI